MDIFFKYNTPKLFFQDFKSNCLNLLGNINLTICRCVQLGEFAIES